MTSPIEHHALEVMDLTKEIKLREKWRKYTPI